MEDMLDTFIASGKAYDAGELDEVMFNDIAVPKQKDVKLSSSPPVVTELPAPKKGRETLPPSKALQRLEEQPGFPWSDDPYSKLWGKLCAVNTSETTPS